MPGTPPQPASRGRPFVRVAHAALWLQLLASHSALAQTAPAPPGEAASEPAAPRVQTAPVPPEDAASKPAAPQVEVLPRVEITGSAGRSKYSTTGTKIDAETRDIPASVQVISPQTLSEQSKSQSINDVLRTVSGVSQSFGTSSGSMPSVTLRGFDSGGYVLQDGYARVGGSYDWSSIDQMEVLKGPASVLYGKQYNIGGQISIQSKKPTTKPIRDMELSIGRWGYQRAMLDLGGALNEGQSIAYRMNLATDSAGSFRDYLFEKNVFFAPSLRMNLGDSDSLLVLGELKDGRSRTDPGLPAPSDTFWQGREYWYPGVPRNRLGYALPISTYIGVPDWNKSHQRNGKLTLEWDHDFNEKWKMKAGVSTQRLRISSRKSDFSWFQPTDETGQPIGPVLSSLQGTTSEASQKDLPVNLDITGEFETKGVKHKFLTGLSTNRYNYLDTGAIFVPLESVASDAWLNPSANYTFVPDPGLPGGQAFSQSQTSKSLYVQDLLAFSDEWKGLIGYRYEIATGMSSNRFGDFLATDEYSATGNTPRLGLVWQPPRVRIVVAPIEPRTWGRR
jgi:outer membrane receptor protein involved in Fe transport